MRLFFNAWQILKVCKKSDARKSEKKIYKVYKKKKKSTVAA